MPELANIMNNLFDRSPLYNSGECTKQPAVNIAETDDHFALEFAVPGYKKEDFKLEVNNHVLTVSAEPKTNTEQTEKYHSRQFEASPFSRSFNLHKERIDEGQVAAAYENGVLTVRLAKREEAKPKPARTINVA